MTRPRLQQRDRLVLQLLRPHLHEVYLDAERRRHGVPQPSRAGRVVLQLVAQGYSNADIARILLISPATVAKHMEHSSIAPGFAPGALQPRWPSLMSAHSPDRHARSADSADGETRNRRG